MSNPPGKPAGVTVTKKQKDPADPNNLPTQNSSKQLTATATQPTASSGGSASTGNVRVVCRVRPTNKKEEEMGGQIAVEFVDDQTISLKTSQNSEAGPPGNHKFAFDRVFKMNTLQADIYEFAAKPVVNSVLEGFNGTVFAYGQTSSGKTHTMQGPSIDDPHLKGIIPRMVNTVFDHIGESPEHVEFTVKISIVEIYLERLRDLLSPEKSNLKVREDKARGIYIEDVTESYVSDETEVYDLMKLGASNRAISATNMNEGSSRSHSVFMMTIHQNNLHELSAKTGKLYLVDLAGSEKISKTGAAGQTLEEAKMINKSLSALGNVINALTENKSGVHIPYRDSKLTRLLQESLGGNARTTLIITCSPNPFNEQETLSTLRFGYRAKSIKNTPKINKEFTVAELKLLLDKAEKTLEQKEKRIKVLESMIEKQGLALPNENEAPAVEIVETKETVQTKAPVIAEENQENQANSESDSEAKEENDFTSMDITTNLQKFSNNDDLTRIQILESELEAERKNVRTQTEKVNILRKEFSLLNNQLSRNEKENEALVNRLTALSLTLQQVEEKFRAKEEEFDYLNELKDTLESEIEEYKRINEALINKLEGRHESEEAQKSNIKDNIENFAEQLTKELATKFSITDQDGLKNLASSCLTKFHTNVVLNKDEKTEAEESKANQLLNEELVNEREKNVKLESDYQKLKEDFERVSNRRSPSKIDNSVIQNGENSVKKPTGLEQNLDQISNIYQQMSSQRLQNRGEAQISERKTQRKTERILNLEKQLLETKDLVGQYKNKIESLKTLIAASSSVSTTANSMFTDKDTENFRLKRESIKKEVRDNVLRDPKNLDEIELRRSIGGGSNLKIVKHIRGGTKHSIDASANKTFLNVLKQPQTPSNTSMHPEDLWDTTEKLKRALETNNLFSSQSEHK